MAKSKSSKAVSNLDVVNADLKARFEGVVNLEAELAVYEKAVKMLEAGEISVRGLKATIEASMEKGSLPTIKPSTAQYFKLSASVRALAGGKDKPLKDVLNATIQAKRMFGKEAEAKIESAKSFAELVKATPKQGEKAKAKRKAEKSEMFTADAVMNHYIALVADLEDITPSDPEVWTKFLKVVESQRKAIIAKSKHPAKASA